VLKIKIENIAKQIISFYNEYDLRVAGKVNNHTAFELIEKIEKNYPVDSIQFSDGTRIWNLIRVFIYADIQKQTERETKEKKINKNSLKSLSFILKEGIVPLKLPHKKIDICGFSSTESRKYRKGKYYDIYLDPLYDVIGENFTVFEWPEISGYRRKYHGKIYSKNYVQMHIPIFTKTFWNILFYKLLSRRNFSIDPEKVLIEIIEFISKTSSIDKDKLMKDVYDFITIFFYIKSFLYKILKDVSPNTVLIRCGYGRFPMALSQACRELGIPSIELQHGLITSYHPAYIKTIKSENRDCVPEYLLTHGDIFTDIVKAGNLFDKNKVISVGFPYLEKIKEETKRNNSPSTMSPSPFQHNILFTSQWSIANEIQDFIIKVAEKLKKSQLNIGIIFKPHPYDTTDYSHLAKYDHIILANKYEDTFKLFNKVDVHSTVYSTSGLEAMAFGKPNIFVDICELMEKSDSQFIVDSPSQFIDTLQNILSNYNEISKQTLELANIFFKPSSKRSLKEFFTKLRVI